MAKKITFKLSESDIDKAINEVKRYKTWIQDKTDKLLLQLSMVGLREASVRFMGAHFDSPTGNDTQLSVEQIGNGYKIVASGSQVWFVEFGAGVYYNGTEPYPSDPGRPSEVSRIGEYGKGMGKRDTWYYKDDNGRVYRTHGTPAAMPMYHAGREIRDAVTEVAREVFGNDRY